MQAKGIKISKLKEATEIREHDVIPIVQDGETKKLKASKLNVNTNDFYTKEEADRLIEGHRHDISDIDNIVIPEVDLSDYYNKREIDSIYELQDQYHSDINSELGRINRSVSNLNVGLGEVNSSITNMSVDIGRINMSVTETNTRIENMDIGSCNFILQSAFIDKNINYECDGNIEIEDGVATITNATHFDMDIGSAFGAIKRSNPLSLSAIASANNSATIPMNKCIGGNINVFSEDYAYINKSVNDLNLNLITIPVVVSINGATSSEPIVEDWVLNRTKAYLSNLKKDGLIKSNTRLIFEPHPLIDGGSVSETAYNPSDKTIFFEKWKNLIIDTLTELNEYEFYGIYIGTNFQQFDTGEDNIKHWSKLCRDLKELYKNHKMIYRTNWWVTAPWDDGLIQAYNDKLNNPIWGIIDVISIAAYFELNDKANPTTDELYNNIMNGTTVYNRGQRVFNEVKAFYDKWNKPVMFGELGCPSKDYGALNPWSNLTSNANNETVQNNLFEAYNRAFVYRNGEYDNSWFLGYSIFTLGTESSEFNVVGKQAQQSIVNAVSFIESNNETNIKCRIINKDNNHTIIDYNLPLSADMNTVSRVCKKLIFDGYDKTKISFELDRSVIFRLSKPMLVQGEKMVSWNPSPQDSEGYTDNKITIFNEKIAQLNIKADNINASVQENTVTITTNKADADSKITEMNQKVGELDIKADNINASVRENTTRITENKGYLDGKITEINEKVAQLDIKADRINASVQESTTIITENKEDSEAKITEVNKKIAQLDIKANNINASVQESNRVITENKTDADNKITEANEKIAQLDIKADNINASVEANTTVITENKADADSKITSVNERVGQLDIKANSINASVKENTKIITANKADADNKITEVTNKVAQLDIKANSISASVEENTAKITENKAYSDSKIVEINRNISAIDIKANNINAKVQENATIITTNKTDLDSKITEANKKIAQLDIRANNINASVQENTTLIEENKADADSKITEANKRIGQIDIKANNINASVESNTALITANKADADKKITEANKKIGQLDIKADNINASVASNTTKITANKADADKKITDVTNKFTQLDLKADSINASVQSNTSKITENKTYLDTKVTEINKSISAVDVKANGISSKVSTLETKTNTIDGKVTNHEGRLSTAESGITAKAIINKVTESLTNGGKIQGVSTVIDKDKFLVKDSQGGSCIVDNGALYLKNGNDIPMISLENRMLKCYNRQGKSNVEGWVQSLLSNDSTGGIGMFAAPGAGQKVDLAVLRTLNPGDPFDLLIRGKVGRLDFYQYSVFQSSMYVHEGIIAKDFVRHARTPSLLKTNTISDNNTEIDNINVVEHEGKYELVPSNFYQKNINSKIFGIDKIELEDSYTEEKTEFNFNTTDMYQLCCQLVLEVQNQKKEIEKLKAMLNV